MIILLPHKSDVPHRSRQAILMALLACWVITPTSGLSAADPAGWRMTWSDEFDGKQLDTTKWDAIHWTTPYNNERQAYHPSRVAVRNGHLVLTADDNEFGGKEYTSGKVESKYVQQYGRWEIRAKLPATQGTWPAIWLLPDTQAFPWPSQGEIDILENRGNQPELISSAYHFGSNPKTRKFFFQEQKASNGGQLKDYHQQFHTYVVEWDASKLRFFVDDVHYHTITDTQTAGFLGKQTAPAETVLNVAVGGDFLDTAQPTESSVWPQQMLVDYVRVYERADSRPPLAFRNGSFEAQAGSLAGWSTFGNVVPNVQTHHEVRPLDGSHVLKIFGQFNGSHNHSGVSQGISAAPGNTISASVSAFVRSDDDLVEGNEVVMRIDYYSEFGGQYKTSSHLKSSRSITLATGETAHEIWHEHTLADKAPAGAVEARLVFSFSQPGMGGGAVHIDKASFVNLDSQENPQTASKPRETASLRSE